MLRCSVTIKLAAILLLLPLATCRKDRHAFHGHRGKLAPQKAGPMEGVRLSDSDLDTLRAGNAVMKQVQNGDKAGTAICIQDVEAPIAAVWFQILDLPNYTKKVSKVKESTNYVVKKNPDGTVTVKNKQVLGVLPGYSYESYYDHTFYPTKSSLTWHLDYDMTSDFDDVSGHWHVQPISATRTRVFYSCDISMKGAVPGPIMNYISKAALKQATAWVKKESEEHKDKTIPTQYGKVHEIKGSAAENKTEHIVAVKPVRKGCGWFRK